MVCWLRLGGSLLQPSDPRWNPAVAVKLKAPPAQPRLSTAIRDRSMRIRLNAFTSPLRRVLVAVPACTSNDAQPVSL